ncbi:MAG: Hsp20/alpha crystallin family protein [Candidatus Thiodiazotropha sp. (ex Dulcina madagascariensis)]|nr:Hsp20/alpha crystallin family protein [Candidatus Thiodiazotropha sp. (ex Dulcina madagascariensis)]
MFGRLSGFNDGLFDEFRRLECEMDQRFGTGPWQGGIRSVTEDSYPPINISTTPSQVDVHLLAAGVDPESLEITIKQNLLTLDGERRLNREDKTGYFRKERFDGAFHRLVSLPDDVDADKVEASYRHGVLHIVIPRRESSTPRRIMVQ